MVTKTLTITADAYNALKRMKTADESFSEVVLRIAERKKGFPTHLIGILKDDPGLLDRVMKNRKETAIEDEKRYKRLFGNQK